MTMKAIMMLATLLLLNAALHAQRILDRLGKKVERKVEQRADRKTDKAIDKGLDEVEVAVSGKAKKKNSTSANGNAGASGVQSGNPGTGFSATSKFDFVPGAKPLVFEDFRQDAVGDFPARWNTNASGEVMTLTGSDAHWLALTGKGAFTPEFITSIPENATIEFDLAVTPAFDFYNIPLFICITESKAKNDFTAWQEFSSTPKHSGVRLHLHPQDAGTKPLGRTRIEVYEKGKPTLENYTNGLEAFNKNNNPVHVALWRQKQRLRIYVGETKIWDIPRAFAEGARYNNFVLSRGGGKEGQHFFITNLRMAIGDPDTRNKLLNEGKFSTSGIYFATGSAIIQSESHGVIKEIATVLKENPQVKIHIIGHTDNVGNDATNQKLSEQRAESVKKYLNKTFDIDNSRMTTSGKGASQPVASNNKPEGRAENRRVEFIKQ